MAEYRVTGKELINTLRRLAAGTTSIYWPETKRDLVLAAAELERMYAEKEKNAPIHTDR